MNKKRILVIGSCGQIGTELTIALRQKYGRDQVLAVDILEKSRAGADQYPYLKMMKRLNMKSRMNGDVHVRFCEGFGVKFRLTHSTEVVSKGYQAVKDISQGNFSLHEVFLDGLMLVSPEVRKYHKVGAIITSQERIVAEYRAALKTFRISGVFKDGELNYFSRVYSGLFQKSLDNLDALTTVLTASELRMSDDERLKVIDRLFAEMEDQLGFLRGFNGEVVQLKLQREREKASVGGIQSLYGQ